MSSETTFTPGPIKRLGRVKSCQIGGFHAIGNESGATAYCSNEGDADLYAAAPEMYAELRRIHDRLKMLSESPVSMTNIEHDDLVRIEKVLAKAVPA